MNGRVSLYRTKDDSFVRNAYPIAGLVPNVGAGKAGATRRISWKHNGESGQSLSEQPSHAG